MGSALRVLGALSSPALQALADLAFARGPSVKEQVLEEGQRSLDKQEYEVNDHAAPICGIRLKRRCVSDLPSLPYVLTDSWQPYDSAELKPGSVVAVSRSRSKLRMP